MSATVIKGKAPVCAAYPASEESVQSIVPHTSRLRSLPRKGKRLTHVHNSLCTLKGMSRTSSLSSPAKLKQSCSMASAGRKNQQRENEVTVDNLEYVRSATALMKELDNGRAQLPDAVRFSKQATARSNEPNPKQVAARRTVALHAKLEAKPLEDC